MRFEIFTTNPADQRGDLLIIGLHEEGELPPLARIVDERTSGRICSLRTRGDTPTRLGETLLVLDSPALNMPRLVIVGLGPRLSYNRRAWRRAYSAALATAVRTNAATVVVAIDRPTKTQLDDYYFGRAVAELTGAALYRINDLKSGKKPQTPAIRKMVAGPISGGGLAQARKGLAHGAAISDGMNLLRDLGNLPGNICTPRYLATRAKKLAKDQRGLRVKVHDEESIRRLKLGCLLAVAQGSDEPPRFIVIEYLNGRRGSAPIVLVGKGVTFDTGGISLKDPSAMDEMKWDMCGAASVLASMQLAARLKLPISVIGLVPATENLLNGRAFKPGDVVTSASGQTVEILNTDAEGRLILCDALNYARHYRPTAVIDIATLTGTCVIALGQHFTGVMANDDQLARELVDAGTRSDDRAWQLPLTEDYAEQLQSNFADMPNVAGRNGGAIIAAAFLSKYTKGMPWAHLDIAGTAWLTGSQKGATGRPLRLLADFLIRRAGVGC